ncbi:APC family permease [Streptomyces sp. CRPSP2-6A1]|nr:APC family permease [Streptomyces sp. CRPSP2-6A1]
MVGELPRPSGAGGTGRRPGHGTADLRARGWAGATRKGRPPSTAGPYRTPRRVRDVPDSTPRQPAPAPSPPPPVHGRSFSGLRTAQIRTIPRAIPLALALTLIVYAARDQQVGAHRPDRVRQRRGGIGQFLGAEDGEHGDGDVVRAGAAVAALGSLLALILGVSRTTLAMARDRHLPHALAAVHPRFQVPHRAELLVGAVVAVLAATADVRGAIGFSSFGVLAYYAIANACAWTLTRDEGRPNRLIPALGLAGCLALAFALPLSSVASGAAVLAFGAAVYGTRHVMTARNG